MRKLAVCLAMLASMPAIAQTPAQTDAVRTLVTGAWTCTSLASGLDITTTSTFQSGGNYQMTMRLSNEQMDVSVGIEGSWVVNGFKLKQTISNTGQVTGKLNGVQIAPETAAQMQASIQKMSTDFETVVLSDGKLTLTDPGGTVTSCVRKSM